MLLLSLLLWLSMILSVAAQEQGSETTNETAPETAQANETYAVSGEFDKENRTNTTNQTYTASTTETEGLEDEIKTEEKQPTTSLDETNGTGRTELNNETSSNETNTTLAAEIVDFTVAVTPTEAKQGDVILTVNVENNGTVPLLNLIPLVTGKGFSVYTVAPIEEVAPGKTAASYVLGQFRDSGDILLTIKINGKSITQTVVVEGSTPQNAEELETAKKRALAALSKDVELLENNYKQLENTIQGKKDDYALDGVNLEGLKGYIRTAQSRLLAGQVEEANTSIILAMTEYTDVKSTVEHARKKSFLNKIRNNILLISTLAGAILTLFAFAEFVKRKQQGIYEKIKEFRVDKHTKIEVHKKKEKKGSTKGRTEKQKAKKEEKHTERKEKEEKKDAEETPKTDAKTDAEKQAS